MKFITRSTKQTKLTVNSCHKDKVMLSGYASWKLHIWKSEKIFQSFKKPIYFYLTELVLYFKYVIIFGKPVCYLM